MILVTGGTGLLGSHLLMLLVQAKLRVRAIYRTSKSTDKLIKVFSYYHSDPQELIDRIEWVQADVLDVGSLEEAMVGVKKVFHCAGAVTFLPSDEERMNLVNVNGTANLVNVCSELPGVRLCHVSSIAAIGRAGNDAMISEKDEWKDSQYNSAYAASKHRGEMEVWRGMAEGLNACIVNPALIIGPGNWTQSTGTIFKRVWEGQRFYTMGCNCFVDVLDVAKAMMRLMDSSIEGERFIVGAENRLFKDVFTRIAENLGRKPPSLKATTWMAEVTWRVEKLICAFTGKKPFITKETAMHAVQLNRYSNRKFLEAFTDFEYLKVDDSLKFICEKFRADSE